VRVVFLGSGAFAIPSFETLLDAGHEVAALVTQPDRQKGRGLALAPPALKPVALARGVTVLQPPRIKAPEVAESLRRLSPEVQVVVAYGQIIPRAVFAIPPLGTINVHASLLPRHRGAAPIQRAIAEGDPVTGVTTMRIDEGLDTGPTLLARSTPIGEDETAPELDRRLALIGAELLIETMRGLADGVVQPKPQDDARATLAPMIRKEDGTIDWSSAAPVLARRVRAFQPWPSTVTAFGGRALKVLRARAEAGDPAAAPGTLLEVDADGIVVAAGGGTGLRLLEVQPESRRPMPATAFAAGARLHPGARFG
jgi:methionyl-tRNA formyltransferase